jgi:hypothetical protein
MKIRPVGARLFHMDGQTDMTKLIVASHNFANTHKKLSLHSQKDNMDVTTLKIPQQYLKASNGWAAKFRCHNWLALCQGTTLTQNLKLCFSHIQ